MDGSRFGPDDLLPVELAQAPTTEAIGTVDSVNGEASIVRVDGTTVPAEAGTEIFLGDVIETGAKSAIGLVFIDDSTFSLSDSGKMTIDEMVYDPATNQGNSLFNVAEGVFTFVSGEIAKTSVDAMQIETPVATIGIRGTAGGGRIVRPADPDGQPSGTFSNFRDPITGQAGEINVFTPTGSQTLNGVNSMTSVANPFVPPSAPVKIPLSALRAVFGAAVAALPRPPARTNQQNQNQDDTGTTPGGQNNQQNGDNNDVLGEGDAAEGDEAAALAAADEAAAAAFNEALAQGIDPGAALALAGEVAAITTARFGVGTGLLDTFNAQNAIDDVLQTLVQVVSGQPVINFGGPATPVPGDPTPIPVDPPPPPPDPIILVTLPPLPPPPPTETETETVVVLEDTEETTNLSATEEDDVLFGGDSGDEFLMIQGSSLGGDDIIDGGLGSDYITLLDLYDGWLRYDPLASSEPQIEYYFDGGSINGSMDLTSVEELYIAPYGISSFSSLSGTSIELNTFGDALKLSITSGDSLLGFVGIGSDSYADYMDLTAGYDPISEDSLNPSDVGGSVLFGLGGDDTLTGADGEDYIFGGADNDILTGHAGNDVIFGGTGTDSIYVGNGSDYADGGDDNDIFYIGYQMEGDNSQTSGTLIGGAGSDAIRLQGSNDFSGVSISGIERFAFQGSASTATFVSSQFGTGNIIEVQPNSNLANHLVINMDSTTFDASTAFSFINTNYGNHTLTINGTTGNDTITAHTAMLAQVLDGGSGSDTLLLTASRNFTSDTLGNFETLEFDGASTVIMTGDQLSGISSINFSNSATEAFTINIAADEDLDLSSVTVTDFTDGVDSLTLNGSTGAEYIAGTSAAEIISDGTGADVIYGRGGADTINLASDGTADTIVIDSTSHFGDTISGFVAGSGGDVLQISLDLTRGNGMETLGMGDTVGSTTGLVGYTGSLNGITDAADIALGIDLNGFNAGESILFGVSNGTDTVMWYWQDATSDGGDSDGMIDVGELSKVGTLLGVTDFGDLTDENLDNFDDGTTDVSGTQTFNMTASVNDVLFGSAGVDTITLSGEAESGDSVDLGGGADTLILDITPNTLSISGTENVEIGNSINVQNLAFTDSTAVTVSNNGAGTSDLDAPVAISNTGSNNLNLTIGTLTGSNFASSTIDLGAGTDTLTLGVSGANSIGASQLAGVETLSVTGGTLEMTSALQSLSDLTTISSASTVSLTALDVTNGVDINFAASDTSTYTLNATTTFGGSDLAWNAISTQSFGGGLVLGTNQSYTLNIGEHFRNAFQSQFGGAKITVGTAISNTVTVVADSSYDSVRGIVFEGANGTGTQNITATNHADGDIIILGSGDNTVSALDGTDSIYIDASTFDLSDSINGGDHADTFRFTGGGTLADSAFGSTSNMEKIVLDSNSYSLTLGTFANTAFSTGIEISTLQSSTSLTLSASAYTSDMIVDFAAATSNNVFVTGSGADNVTIGSGFDQAALNGGDDTLHVTATTLTSADTINGGADTDTLAFTEGGTILDSAFTNVSQFEEITIDDYAYDLILGTEANAAFTSGVTISSSVLGGSLNLDASGFTHVVNADMTGNGLSNTLTGGTGNDTLIGGSGNDTIYGGSGDDTLTDNEGTDHIYGGIGADIIHLVNDSGGDVVHYVAADILSTRDDFLGNGSTGFRRGPANSDRLDLDVANTVTNGTGDVFQTLASGTVGANTAVINYTTTIGSFLDAATVATALNTLDGLDANNRLFFMTTDGVDSALWYWDDTAGSTNPGDGNADADEMFDVATIAASYGESATNWTADNFEGVN